MTLFVKVPQPSGRSLPEAPAYGLRLGKGRAETTVIYVTHDQTEALAMGDRIVVMKLVFRTP